MEFKGFRQKEEVFESMKEASTLADKDARPYEGAIFSLEKVKLNEIRPTQFYAIEDNIDQQEKIRNFISQYGEDTLQMIWGGVDILQENGAKELMIPPIVEHTKEGLLLLDGTHRAMFMRRLGMAAGNFIVINNIKPEFDMTERRLPNEWDEITMFKSLDHLKRARKNGFVHRREGLAENQDNSYRDFSHLTNRRKDERK